MGALGVSERITVISIVSNGKNSLDLANLSYDQPSGTN
jgi:hypothetical protein